MSHHEVLDAVHKGTSVILCEHTNTERGYLKLYKATLEEFLKLEVLLSEYDSDPNKIVWLLYECWWSFTLCFCQYTKKVFLASTASCICCSVSIWIRRRCDRATKGSWLNSGSCVTESVPVVSSMCTAMRRRWACTTRECDMPCTATDWLTGRQQVATYTDRQTGSSGLRRRRWRVPGKASPAISHCTTSTVLTTISTTTSTTARTSPAHLHLLPPVTHRWPRQWFRTRLFSSGSSWSWTAELSSGCAPSPLRHHHHQFRRCPVLPLMFHVCPTVRRCALPTWLPDKWRSQEVNRREVWFCRGERPSISVANGPSLPLLPSPKFHRLYMHHHYSANNTLPRTRHRLNVSVYRHFLFAEFEFSVCIILQVASLLVVKPSFRSD